MIRTDEHLHYNLCIIQYVQTLHLHSHLDYFNNCLNSLMSSTISLFSLLFHNLIEYGA